MEQKYTACMTLRLPPEVDEQIVEAAYEQRVTKTTWIRMAILQRLKARWSRQEKTTR